MSMYKLRIRIGELETALAAAQATADAATLTDTQWKNSQAVMALEILWREDNYQDAGMYNPDGTLN